MADASDAFNASLAIAERLAKAEPSNTQAPRDLAWFDQQIAGLK